MLRPRAAGGLVAVFAMLALTALSLADPRPGAGRTRVGPAPADPDVQVAVVGDFGMDDPHEATVAEMVASWDPDLVVTTGDNYYLGGEEPGTDRYDRTVGRYYCAFLRDAAPGPFCPSGGTSPSNRFLPATGNHDHSNAGIATYVAAFALPGAGVDRIDPDGTELYYGVRAGPLDVFVLDSEGALTSAASMDAQRSWLRRALTASTNTWQVVVFHHPPYSSSGVHGSTPDMAWPFAAWGADLVLNGHDHTYERVVHDGIDYVVDGLGGAPIYAFGTTVAGSVARYNGGFGAVRLRAEARTLTTELVGVDGTIVDRVVRRTGA